MKTKLWKRLTWDLRIFYNKITKSYFLKQYDYGWVTVYEDEDIKNVIKKKHNKIKDKARKLEIAFK